MTTRRDFINKSSMTALGIGLAGIIPAELLAQRRKIAPSDKLVVGLIGCNSMGFANVEDFLLQPEVECAALCDVDQNVLERRNMDILKLQSRKPDLYKDYREILQRNDIDAVIIGTPDHWHCLPAVHACEAGKDVYVEKPLANSITETILMLKAARKYDRVVQVGQQQRSCLNFKSAMDFIWSGKLGKVRRINIWANFNYGAGREKMPDSPVPEGVDYDMWLGPAPVRTFNEARFHGMWRMFWDYGGGLMTDWGVHLIDMALWAMNVDYFPKSVAASGGTYAHMDRALEMPDTLTVLYEMNDFLMTWEHNGGVQSGPYDQLYGLSYVGTNGTLVIDRDKWRVFPEWGDVNESGDEKWRMERVEESRADGKSHQYHVQNFINCVKTREKPAADIAIGQRVAAYAHLGNMAFRTGNKLVYDDVTNTVAGDPKATAMLTPVYREPYELPKI